MMQHVSGVEVNLPGSMALDDDADIQKNYSEAEAFVKLDGGILITLGELFQTLLPSGPKLEENAASQDEPVPTASSSEMFSKSYGASMMAKPSTSLVVMTPQGKRKRIGLGGRKYR